ncbi:hypothetical protein EMIHUDRAFT_432226 [Emiliania huxleyi CCMP1516]|uniref:DUF501 domain-containing protein n=2 Tax=Emiliania huxleyi TaxID=2903 RepID=A0A0D3J356_EMIH1|nr:hypothetical protein EMIHUDRAFT_432226 [Emiliania huxleyi CCMP1516]EOD17941.1 hypothetical protein EMIHUDRAFT_432226 [Emiliania huxleyi CCMP1516]|eukprot:XP_005770370.1 hypothetical protein EMIHUDRAFT_432226 [Emiliania huxleyi CCMP1516]
MAAAVSRHHTHRGERVRCERRLFTAAAVSRHHTHRHERVRCERRLFTAAAVSRHHTHRGERVRCERRLFTAAAVSRHHTHRGERVRCERRLFTAAAVSRRDPWPNLFWLVDPRLFQCARALQNLRRWRGGLLSSRRGATLGQPWAVEALRDAGVGGLRYTSQVKCLHAHLAHALAGGANPVGERVLRLVREGEGEKRQ